jgi:single-strand DNA-binding protein
MNSISLSGNLGRDAEIREFSGENFLIKTSIAHNYKQGESEKTLWLSCEIWRQGKTTAEKTASVLKKGRKIGVVGQLLDDSYEKDGQKIKAVKVKVDRFYLLDNGGQQSQQQQKTAESAEQQQPTEKYSMEATDLPF